jgi:hypothetical protein
MGWAGLEARMVAYYLEDLGVIRAILKFILDKLFIAIWTGMNYFQVETSLDFCDYRGKPSCIRTEYTFLS